MELARGPRLAAPAGRVQPFSSPDGGQLPEIASRNPSNNPSSLATLCSTPASRAPISRTSTRRSRMSARMPCIPANVRIPRVAPTPRIAMSSAESALRVPAVPETEPGKCDCGRASNSRVLHPGIFTGHAPLHLPGRQPPAVPACRLDHHARRPGCLPRPPSTSHPPCSPFKLPAPRPQQVLLRREERFDP